MNSEPTELDKAIATLECYIRFPLTGNRPTHAEYVIIIDAAKRTLDLESKFTAYSNAELLGATERCQFEAMKVRLKEVEKERDELLLCWNGSLQDTFEMTGTMPKSRTEQSALNNKLRSAYKEALGKLRETRFTMVSNNYVNLLDYLNGQFPPTAGHLPLVLFCDAVEQLLSNPLAIEVMKEKKV